MTTFSKKNINELSLSLDLNSTDYQRAQRFVSLFDTFLQKRIIVIRSLCVWKADISLNIYISISK